MQVFESKVDTWLLAVLLITILVCLYAGYVLIKGKRPIVAVLTLGIGSFLPIWLLFSTQYKVTDGILYISSGPSSYVIPVSSISGVRETKNSRSSPALSLDRLEISYGNGQKVLVSPKEKEKFLSTLGITLIE